MGRKVGGRLGFSYGDFPTVQGRMGWRDDCVSACQRALGTPLRCGPTPCRVFCAQTIPLPCRRRFKQKESEG